MTKSFKSASTIILGLVILLVGYFGVYSYWGEMGEARELKAASQTENDRLKKALADIQAFVSDYNTNLSQATIAEKALPVGDADVAELLDYYSKMVGDSGLAMIDLSMQEDTVAAAGTQAKDSIQGVDWDIQASGSFEAFKDFLMRARQGLRLTDVLGVSVGQADSESQDGRTLRYNIKLRTYYQK